MSRDVLLFFDGTWRAEERGKRHGIVGRMEKPGRRRKLEVRGVPSHHFSTSNVQQPHQRNPEPTRAEQAESQVALFITQNPKVALFITQFFPEIFPKLKNVFSPKTILGRPRDVPRPPRPP